MCFLVRSATRRPPPFAHFAKGRGAASRLGSSCVKIRVSVSAKNTTKTRDFWYREGSTLIRTVCVAFLQGSAQISRVSRCNWPGRSGGARQGAWTVKTQEFWHTGPHGACFCGKSSIPGGHLSSGAWGVGLTREKASDWRPQLRGAVAKRWISFEVPCFAMVRRVRWCENDVFLLSTSLRG